MQVVLETNERMAAGWAQRRAQAENPDMPGQELVRLKQRKSPRDWHARWRAAAEEVGWEGVAKSGSKMIALLTSPIWRTISRFDLPYPPFDFGSGMGVLPVPYEECRKLGLVPDLRSDTSAQEQQPAWTPSQKKQEAGELSEAAPITREMMQLGKSLTAYRRSQFEIVRQSLNHNFSVPASSIPRDVRAFLHARLGGLVYEKDGRFAMSDLNGTTPMSSQALAEIWKKEIPRSIVNKQKDMLTWWVNDSGDFNNKTTDEQKAMMRDFLTRIRAEEVDNKEKIAYRGLSWNTRQEYEDFLAISDEMLGTKPGSAGDSYSPSHVNCENYMTKQWQVEVRYIRPAQLKNIRPFYSAMPGLKQNLAQPTSLESEFILIGGTRLKVIKRYKVPTQTGKARTVLEVIDFDEATQP